MRACTSTKKSQHQRHFIFLTVEHLISEQILVSGHKLPLQDMPGCAVASTSRGPIPLRRSAVTDLIARPNTTALRTGFRTASQRPQVISYIFHLPSEIHKPEDLSQNLLKD